MVVYGASPAVVEAFRQAQRRFPNHDAVLLIARRCRAHDVAEALI